MRLADLSRLAAQLEGVAERRRDGLLDWRYHGRLVARQLDDSHVVIRASFGFCNPAGEPAGSGLAGRCRRRGLGLGRRLALLVEERRDAGVEVLDDDLFR